MEAENKLVALEYRVKALEESDVKNQNTHREFYNRIQAVEVNHAVSQEQHAQIMQRFDTIAGKFETITGKLEMLTGQSGKRWNGLVDKAVFAVVGIVIAYIFTQIGF